MPQRPTSRSPSTNSVCAKQPAHAFFHVHRIDQALPRWVREGLAQYTAAMQTPRPDGLEQYDARFPLLGGFQVYGYETAWDEEDFSPDQRVESFRRIQFFLESHDGQYAAPFFDALRQLVQESEIESGRAPRIFRTNDANVAWYQYQRLQRQRLAVDALLEDLIHPYNAWQTDPKAGQPKVEVIADATEEQKQQQQKMAAIIRLIDRLQSKSTTAPIQYKVISFGEQQTQGTRAETINHHAGRTPYDLRVALHELQQQARRSPWSVRREDGHLLHSSDAKGVREFLDVDDHRYGSVYRDKPLAIDLHVRRWQDHRRAG